MARIVCIFYFTPELYTGIHFRVNYKFCFDYKISINFISSLKTIWCIGNSGADDLVDDALLIGRVGAIQTPDGAYRAITPRRQRFDACVVGARRLPRRVAYRGWYGLRAFVRRGWR